MFHSAKANKKNVNCKLIPINKVEENAFDRKCTTEKLYFWTAHENSFDLTQKPNRETRSTCLNFRLPFKNLNRRTPVDVFIFRKFLDSSIVLLHWLFVYSHLISRSTHFFKIAISFSSASSFPFKSLLLMHFMAYNLCVTRSSASTTSEKAPLQKKTCM